MNVTESIPVSSWKKNIDETASLNYTPQLEQGKILLCPRLNFELFANERKFLSPTYVSKGSKNISFHPVTKKLQGVECTETDAQQLSVMLNRFCSAATQLIKNVFPGYQLGLQLGRTSFRPIEIAGRKSSYRKDDTRLHVDAFPSAPNQGRRILRVFTNINPHSQPRLWRVGEPFEQVVEKFIPHIKKPKRGWAALLRLLKITKSYRTFYDHFMLHMHDRMKADLMYQETCPQVSLSFEPGTSWIVQTDHVSHAAMAGQHVLEQTFYLPVEFMQNPNLSPLRILEKKLGCKLV